MRCLRCGECCKETEMLLSNEDIERLEKKGYGKAFFARSDKNGYCFLRNLNGYCVFFDPEKQKCTERANRPLGCRIYPILFDEDKGILVDNLCPAKGTFSEKEKMKRGKKVLKLLEKIDAEATKRHSE